MTLLASERIHPYYAQVAFSDPAKPDYPDWGARDAPIVATSSCIAVGTRPDHLGDVDIEVWLGAPDDEALMGAPKWTGLVSVSGDHAVIGAPWGTISSRSSSRAVTIRFVCSRCLLTALLRRSFQRSGGRSKRRRRYGHLTQASIRECTQRNRRRRGSAFSLATPYGGRHKRS